MSSYMASAQPAHSWPDGTPRGADALDATTLHLRQAEDRRADEAGLKRGQLTTWPAISEFLFAGAATFTLVSLVTGRRFTYKAQVKKTDMKAGLADCAYFVQLLRGPDNTADYAYLGVLRRPDRFFTTPKSRITQHPTSHAALLWFLEALKADRQDVLGKQLEFWHTGRCCYCTRLLTVPESVERGIGPECAKRRPS